MSHPDTIPSTLAGHAPRFVEKAKRWVLALAAMTVAVVAGVRWAPRGLFSAERPEIVATGNGRIEAITIDISSKAAMRVKEVLVREGDFVDRDQIVARMDATELEARHRQAEAELHRATTGVAAAKSLVVVRQTERAQASAVVAEREAHRDAAAQRFERTKQLVKTGALPDQVFDDDRAAYDGAVAELTAAHAQVAASDAAVIAATIQVADAESAVEATRASLEAIGVEIEDAVLRSPRAGRVQVRVSEPGEMLAPGGRVLNVVDLEDVYMTFFLPTEDAGKVAIGTEVRIALDASTDFVVPAKVAFVADVAQFTPKTVETEKERQKLMFRVKAQIAPDLVRRHLDYVKIGMPGTANVRLDPSAPWPKTLDRSLLQ